MTCGLANTKLNPSRGSAAARVERVVVGVALGAHSELCEIGGSQRKTAVFTQYWQPPEVAFVPLEMSEDPVVATTGKPESVVEGVGEAMGDVIELRSADRGAPDGISVDREDCNRDSVKEVEFQLATKD